MSPATESLVRNILVIDGTIPAEVIDKAVGVLNGKVPEDDAPLHAIKPSDVARHLSVSLRTVNRFVERGLLDRVYDGHTYALGISRDSYFRLAHEMAEGRRRRLR